MHKLIIVMLSLGLLFLPSCKKKEGSASTPFSKRSVFSKLSYDSPEYQKMALDHMKAYFQATAKPVDTFWVDGQNFFIQTNQVLADTVYQAMTRETAREMNKFKKNALGYFGVSVTCISRNRQVAHAVIEESRVAK